MAKMQKKVVTKKRRERKNVERGARAYQLELQQHDRYDHRHRRKRAFLGVCGRTRIQRLA